MEGDDARSLREQLAASSAAIAALTAAVSALTVSRAPVQAPTITIAALFDEFEKTRAGDKSWRVNRNRLLPLARRLGHLPAASLTPIAWAAHRSARAAERDRYGKLPKAHLLTIELGRAKELLRFGVANGFLETSPLANAKREKTISARETWLDEAGVQALLTGVDAVPGELPRLIMRAFILLCLDGMMRFNEALHLRRDRIRDGVVELSAKSTKSKRRRMVGLTPRTLEAVAAVPPVVGRPQVFMNAATGSVYSESSIRYWFRIACVASGVDALAVEGERVVIHTLRHSGASAADARGASALAIKDALGHASLAVTEKYLHRHREAGARELAKLMHEGAERERRGPQRSESPSVNRDTRPLNIHVGRGKVTE